MSNLPPDVVKFLKEHDQPPVLDDSDLTRYTAAEEWGCTLSAAEYRLGKLVDSGELEKIVKSSSSGKSVNVYVQIVKGGVADKK